MGGGGGGKKERQRKEEKKEKIKKGKRDEYVIKRTIALLKDLTHKEKSERYWKQGLIKTYNTLRTA